MRINKLILSFLYSLVSICCLAQIKMDRSRELQIGDALRLSKIVEILNDKEAEFDFANYKEDLLILDFFDTFCSACIANMPKVVSLQKEFGAEVKIIQVTWQDKKTIQNFFRTNKFLKEHKAYPTTIASDTMLHHLFPHQSSPHVVWIYRGNVVAITAADVLNSKNITALLSEGKIDLPRKDDFLPAKSGNDEWTNAMAFSRVSAFNSSVKQNGFAFELDSASQNYRTSFNNMPILNIYLSILGKIEQKKFLITNDRIEWRVKDKTIYNYDETEKEPSKWMRENAICYERIDKVQRREQEQAKVVLHDMNSFFGLNVYYSIAKRKCLVLKRVPVSKPGKVNIENMQNLEGTSVLAFILDYSKKYPPVVDDVKSMQDIAIGEFNNIDELNQQLATYGMLLTPDEREIEVVVFEEIQ